MCVNSVDAIYLYAFVWLYFISVLIFSYLLLQCLTYAVLSKVSNIIFFILKHSTFFLSVLFAFSHNVSCFLN